MSAADRPKIYLFLCILAIVLETAWMVAKAPVACLRCKNPLVSSRELPEFCQPCVEQIRAALQPFAVPYPVDPSDPVVTLETSRGDVVVEIFPKQAPRSTENFLAYVRARHFDGVIFHRLEDYLCCAGRFRGGYDGQALTVIPQLPPIPSESDNGLENRAGTISLPHEDGNADSATSDFFFNLRDNPNYNRTGATAKTAGYAVFGQVIRGYEVLEALKSLPLVEKSIGPGYDRMPRDPVTIRRAFESTPATVGRVAALASSVRVGR